MKKYELLQSVYARLNGKPEGMPEPMILAKADSAIKAVVKQLVYSNSPVADLFIKATTLTPSGQTKNGLPFVDLPDSILQQGKRLHLVSYKIGGMSPAMVPMEPVNSWGALETLPALHKKPYYRLHENTIYYKLPPDVFISSIYVESHKYPGLENFPFELVDILLEVLMPMLGLEPPQQNEKQKK